MSPEASAALDLRRRELRTRVAEAEAQLAPLRAELEALDHCAELLARPREPVRPQEPVRPTPPPPPRPVPPSPPARQERRDAVRRGHPSLHEMVVDMLRGHDSPSGMTDQEIYDSIIARWGPVAQRNSLQVTTSRLRQQGVVVRTEGRRNALAPSQARPGPEAAAPEPRPAAEETPPEEPDPVSDAERPRRTPVGAYQAPTLSSVQELEEQLRGRTQFVEVRDGRATFGDPPPGRSALDQRGSRT